MPAEHLTYLSDVDASTAKALETEPLMTCFLGKIFYAWRHRNAYFGRESNQYFDAKAFHQDAWLLKSQIRRARGSQWRIGERPAVVAVGTEHALIVLQINSTKPFSSVRLPRKALHSLAGVAAHYLSYKPNSMFRFVASAESATPAQLPFMQYVRAARHSYWKREHVDLDIQSCTRHVAQLNRLMQKRPSDRAVELNHMSLL